MNAGSLDSHIDAHEGAEPRRGSMDLQTIIIIVIIVLIVLAVLGYFGRGRRG
jgi:hypothetical protein